jgi:hypothetical protein
MAAAAEYLYATAPTSREGLGLGAWLREGKD